jgi:hypothetical protein
MMEQCTRARLIVCMQIALLNTCLGMVGKTRRNESVWRG